MTTATKTRTRISLKKVGYVILYVKDASKTAPFYRDTLGIPIRFAEKEWAEFETEGFTLALHGLEKAPAPQSETAPRVVFDVKDVRAAHEALREKGLKIAALKQVCEHEGNVGLSGEFTDPDGNRLSIYGSVPKTDWKG